MLVNEEVDIEELTDIITKDILNNELLKKTFGLNENKIKVSVRKMIIFCIKYGFVLTLDKSYLVSIDYYRVRRNENEDHKVELENYFGYNKRIKEIIKNERSFVHQYACDDSKSTILILQFNGENVYKLIYELQASYPGYNLVFANSIKKYSNQAFLPYALEGITSPLGITYSRIIRFSELIQVFDDNRIKENLFLFPIDYKNNIASSKIILETTLDGFTAFSINSPIFKPEIGKRTKCFVAKLTYDDFYPIERSIDLFNVCEVIKKINLDDNSNTAQVLLFQTNCKCELPFLYNPLNISDIIKKLNFSNDDEKMLQNQYNSVDDIISCIPVKYENKDELFNMVSKDNSIIMNNVIPGFIFQENFEYGNSNQSRRKFKDRIRRINLGTVLVQPKEEIHYNYFVKEKSNYILDPFRIGLMLSVDKDTHAGVLFLMAFSINTLPTKYLDDISRNDITVLIDLDEITLFSKKQLDKISRITIENKDYAAMNLYDYLEYKFKINKIGQPKNLIISPKNRDEFVSNENLLCSLLYAENLFTENEELGKIIDESMFKTINSKWGDSIYDYATSYNSKSTILQLGNTYRDYVYERIDFEVVMLFYLELVLFEDASIQIANYDISNFIYELNIKNDLKSKINEFIGDKPHQILVTIDAIQQEYAKSLDFWNVQMNYQSSKQTIDQIRKHFDIEANLQQLKRTRNEIQEIYKSKATNLTNIRSLIITLLGLILTGLNIYKAITTTDYVQRVVAIIIIIIILSLFFIHQIVGYTRRYITTSRIKSKK